METENSWRVQLYPDEQVVFTKPGFRVLARVDSGRFSGDFEEFLMRGLGRTLSGWSVDLPPSPHRGKEVKDTAGVRFLRFTDHRTATPRVLDFYRGPCPWELVRAYEGRYANAEGELQQGTVAFREQVRGVSGEGQESDQDQEREQGREGRSEGQGNVKRRRGRPRKKKST